MGRPSMATGTPFSKLIITSTEPRCSSRILGHHPHHPVAPAQRSPSAHLDGAAPEVLVDGVWLLLSDRNGDTALDGVVDLEARVSSGLPTRGGVQ